MGMSTWARSIFSSITTIVLLTALTQPASAWIDGGYGLDDDLYRPDGIHVIDGSYVININELHVNITNHGLIGSQFTQVYPYSHAPSGQWPAGSGVEYLWAGGLWVGGSVHDDIRVSTGQPERELRPTLDLWSTLYESRNQTVVRPGGNPHTSGFRIPDDRADDDGDGMTDEEILNGRDDDADGLIDEDYAQFGDQMMVCTMYDNTRLASEVYSDHSPLDLRVRQTASAFSASDYANFVSLRYEITNIGTTAIEDMTMGFYADCDIGPRDQVRLGHDDRTGFFQGAVRTKNGTWANVRVGYMYDAGEQPVSGYFGVTSVGGTRIANYQYFTGNRTYEAGGVPIDDDQRYDIMSKGRIANDFEDAGPQDYSFIVSTGAGRILAPNQTTYMEMALVAGDGLQGLLENCASVHVAYGGAYFDLDDNLYTGYRGRETKLCFEQVPESWDPIYQQVAMHMQGSCVGRSNWPPIRSWDFFSDPSGLYCIWVNNDNCDECSNRTGLDCTNDSYLFWREWNCWRDDLTPAERIGCTGIAGRETRVPWYDTRIPPPAPSARVWPRDRAVHIFWSDESEYAIDFEMEMVDFESYRVWRSDNWERPVGTSLATGPGTDSWQMVAEFDIINDMEIPVSETVVDTVALGRNTGLEVAVYRPACLDDRRFIGLAAAMQLVVDADSEGQLLQRPAVRNSSGIPIPGLEGLIAWETFPTVLDTFFAVTERVAATGVKPKRSVRFYEYIDRKLHNGFLYFYAVTATDRSIEVIDSRPINRGYGIDGSPNSQFSAVRPATSAQTVKERVQNGANIYVWPNPVTTESLADFQQFAAGKDDPTGTRIAFANLPAANNRIRIYTAAGDLLQELHHDGTGGYGQITWNLVTRNGQEIVSGIYLYSVESDDDGFEDFTGKFVVIR